MRRILFLSSLFVFLFTSSIWATDISGTWVLKYTGSQGDERVLDLVIKAAGENLTVSTTHPSLGEMAGTGTFKGNDIVMTLTATGERKVGFELKGTVNGNTMSGTREVKTADRDASERSESGGRGDSSGGGREGAEMGARGNTAGGTGEGAQMRTRGDTAGSAQGGGREGAESKAPEGRSSRERSVKWTAEKK